MRTVVVAVLLLCLTSLSVFAQDTTPTSEPSTTAADSVTADLGALADILNDPEALQRLITALEQTATAGPDQNTETEGGQTAEISAPETAETSAPETAAPIGRQIADVTQQVAQAGRDAASQIWRAVERLPRTLAGAQEALTSDVVYTTLISLLWTILVTYAAYIILRILSRIWDHRIAKAAAQSGALGRFALAIVSALLDALVVILAWAVGYAVITALSGEAGNISVAQSLYLNAFLAVGLVRLIVRILIAPREQALRLISLPDGGAKTLYNWISIAVGILGYGQLLAVPIITRQVSFLAGASLSTVLSIIVILMAIAAVAIYRRPIAGWLTPQSATEGKAKFRTGLAGLWFVPMLVYLAVLLVIVMARPGGVLIPLLTSSGLVVVTILAGMMAMTLIRRSIQRGVTLPNTVTDRLPLLQNRLNTFIPTVLTILRLVVVLAITAITLDIVGLLDIGGWLSSSAGSGILLSFISIAVILLFGFAIWLAFSSWVEYRLNPSYGSIPTSRETTLLTLLRSAATIVLIIIVSMFALSEMGLNIAPLIASAGVVGLAVGFGAQKLVQDVITGVFIQFENAINVGDVISVGGITGAVEKLTIRSVSLRDLHGIYHIIPFSSVDLVSNYMRDFSYSVCDMGIAYREDVEFAKQAMHDAFGLLLEDEEHKTSILGELEWMGLNSFGDNAIVLRARIKTLPGKQWGIGRAYNTVLKTIFDERGIEIPFPHQTIYWGEDREGKAPPLRVLRVEEDKSNRPTAAPELVQPSSPVESTSPEQDMPD